MSCRISTNEGLDWTTPTATVLPNNNAGIEAFPLSNGEVIIAFNPQTSSRDPLAVALSPDGGVTWPKQRDVQHGVSGMGVSDVAAGNEFSYPTILQVRYFSFFLSFFLLE